MAQGGLRRELGVGGATMLGLGSIVGTGVFVSLGLVAGLTGPAVVLAVVLAGGVAACNALSSAQLAASHPVSGGTYEYGYRYLNPTAGFVAGWLFLLAKSASAASAALGFAGYVSALAGLPPSGLAPLACATVVLFTILVRSGMRRSSWANTAIVSVTLAALLWFVLGGLPQLGSGGFAAPFWSGPATNEPAWRAFLHGCALMFVAFTGYGRVATLGEEVHHPQVTIPRAITATLVASTLLYLAVAAVGVGGAGADVLARATAEQAAPLVAAAEAMTLPAGRAILTLGAVTAMLGVLLNLILGLSRVLLAMGRRGDMPSATAHVDAGGSPTVAVVVMGVVIAGLTLLGSVKTTWSFSAFCVLVYYALTNLCALRLPPEAQLYPRPVAMIGLAACGFLALWVEPVYWLIGVGCVVVGLVWRAGVRRQVSRD